MRNVNIRKQHKIADRWEPTVYVVVKQPNAEIPVYVVSPEDGDGRDLVLHRDLLLPCGFLPVKEDVGEKDLTTERMKPKTQSKTRESHTKTQENEDEMQVKALDPKAPEFHMPVDDAECYCVTVDEEDFL